MAFEVRLLVNFSFDCCRSRFRFSGDIRRSGRAVIRLFEKEPGVLIRLHPETMHKRSRRMIHIPRAVYLRVRAKLAHG